MSNLPPSPRLPLLQKEIKNVSSLNEFQIFVFITSTAWARDPFLKRKLCDTFRFAFLGFITTGELDDRNPGLVSCNFNSTY